MRKLSFSILLVSVFGFSLAACTPGSLPTPTPTSASGGGDAAGSSGTDSGTGAAAAAGRSMGLTPASLAPAPVGAVPPAGSLAAPADMFSTSSATLAIGGDLPLMLTGGTCSVLDGELYLSVPPIPDAPPPYASLVVYAASDGSDLVRGGYLVWARSEATTDSALVSTQDLFVITINEDRFSGRFDGTAHKVVEGVPVQEVINVTGVFNCVAGLVRVGGPHPVDLTGAQCNTDPAISVSAGQAGQNAALLVVEPGAQPGRPAAGGLSWRVGGAEYTTNWLSVTLNTDAISGSYHGEAHGPDDNVFEVHGAFNCLGT